MDSKTYRAEDYETFKADLVEKPGFYEAMWCGCEDCEAKIKEDTSATVRCLGKEEQHFGSSCLICGKDAKHMVYLAKAY